MKLIVKVQRNDSMIDEVFNDLEREGQFKKMQLRVFKSVYKSRIKGLYHLIKLRLSSYKREKGDDWLEAVDEGDKELIELRKNQFEKFMYGDERDLNTEKEYQRFKNDRIIIKVTKYFKRGKDKAIKMALGEGRVMDFFTRYGIDISWRVEG